MNAKHTPGDWYVSGSGETLCIAANGPKGRIELAVVYSEAEYDPALPMRANAELMAAAPTLLAACEFAHKYAVMQAEKGHALPGQLVGALYDAIRLARGPVVGD